MRGVRGLFWKQCGLCWKCGGSAGAQRYFPRGATYDAAGEGVEAQAAPRLQYRTHVQDVGWQGWAKNGASAGTAGYSYRLEAMEVRIVAKGGAAPGSTANAFRQVDARTLARNNAIASGKQVYEGTLKILTARQVEAMDVNQGYSIYQKKQQYLSWSEGQGCDVDKSTFAVLILDNWQNNTGREIHTMTARCHYIRVGDHYVYSSGRYKYADNTSRWKPYNGKRVCIAGDIRYDSSAPIGQTAYFVSPTLLYTL